MAKTKPKPQKEHDMKSALALCALATSSDTAVSGMVRVSDGFMTAFSGVFAISVPMPMEIGCCFNPLAIAPFFRKDRDAIAFTLKNDKLVLTEGKERLTVSTLAPEQMQIIDNFGTPIPVEFNMTLLKVAADIIDPECTRPYAKGVTFSDGGMSSTDNRVFLTGASGLPEKLRFTLPKESCLALGKFKSPVVSILADDYTVKFFFLDGSSLCSKQIVAQFPDISHLFEGEWTDLNLKADLLDVVCGYFEFLNGTAYYHSKDSIGMFESSVSDVSVNVYKKPFDYLLRIGNNISVSKDNMRIKSIGEKCVAVCSTKIS